MTSLEKTSIRNSILYVNKFDIFMLFEMHVQEKDFGNFSNIFSNMYMCI